MQRQRTTAWEPPTNQIFAVYSSTEYTSLFQSSSSHCHTVQIQYAVHLNLAFVNKNIWKRGLATVEENLSASFPLQLLLVSGTKRETEAGGRFPKAEFCESEASSGAEAAILLCAMLAKKRRTKARGNAICKRFPLLRHFPLPTIMTAAFVPHFLREKESQSRFASPLRAVQF
jgi:hypothetical protein